MQLTQRDLVILLDLYRWRAMLSQQLRQRHFEKGAWAYARLEALAEAGYIHPEPLLALWKGNRKKKVATYYRIAEEGVAALEEARLVEGARPAWRNRPHMPLDLQRAELANWPGVLEAREAKQRGLVDRRLPCDAVTAEAEPRWHLYVKTGLHGKWVAAWKSLRPTGKHLFLAPNDEAYHQMEEVLQKKDVHLLSLSAASEAQRLIRDPLWAYREAAAALESYWPRTKVAEHPSGWRVERREKTALLLETITGNLAAMADVRAWHPEVERDAARPTYLIVAVANKGEASRLTERLAPGASNAVSFWCAAEGEVVAPSMLAGRAS